MLPEIWTGTKVADRHAWRWWTAPRPHTCCSPCVLRPTAVGGAVAAGDAVGGSVGVGDGSVGGAPRGCCRTTTCGGWPATGVSNTLWPSASPWDL